MAIKLGKEVREVVRKAIDQGFSWNGGLTGSGHVKLRHKNGGIVIIPATPSKYTWKKNAESDLRKVASGIRNPGCRSIGQLLTALVVGTEVCVQVALNFTT